YHYGDLFATTILKEKEEKGMLGFSLYEIGETKGVNSIEIYALSGDDITIGDINISDLKATGESINLPALDALANHKTNTTCNVPKYNLYVLENQVTVPEIKGDNLSILETDKGKIVAHEMSSKLQDELKEWTRNFFERYTQYVVFGKGFEDIADDIFYTSPIYNTVSKFRYMWDYYYNYEIEMKEFYYSDFIQYTDDIVSVRVKYHYTQTLDRSKLDNHPDMNVYLYNNNGQWQIIEMEISEWSE
ncbi:MAG: hypothetical protein Q4E99_03915, partial [Bacillota bacterium]|nr:hypothetical protein [Bacillota bacterium]